MASETEIRIGQVWEDRDKRTQGRRMVVVETESGVGSRYVTMRMRHNKHTTKIRKDQLPKRWRLVEDGPV